MVAYKLGNATSLSFAMNVYTLPTPLRIQPSGPVELAISVDGETVRVLIEWAVLERWLGERANDAEAVREALRQRRQSVERVVQARVYAHGVPLSGELPLTLVDFPARR